MAESRSERRRIIVAITGASGALYAQRVIEQLVAGDVHVHLIVSDLGRRLLADELDMKTVDLDALAGGAGRGEKITLLGYRDVGASVASGSYQTDGIIVVPCSNNKLAEFAHGLGDNLISRAVQVCLKERRRVIVVHREMPLGLIELRNMTQLTEAGAIICPANPGWYTRPETIDEVVNTVAGRVLDLCGVRHTLHPRWGEPPAEK